MSVLNIVLHTLHLNIFKYLPTTCALWIQSQYVCASVRPVCLPFLVLSFFVGICAHRELKSVMCENEIFVLVRYKVDHTTAVVSSTKIRNFCPITIEDFNPDVLYEVFWSGDQNTRGGYYEAQIIDMAGIVTFSYVPFCAS